MFDSREEAAQMLSIKLLSLVKEKNIVVLALARGAITMGKIIANYFSVPFDILVFKKIGVSQNKELAIGVIGPKNTIFWNNDILKKLGLSKKEIISLKKQKEKERRRLEKELRLGRKPLELLDKTVILIDDGVATGATVMAARIYLRKQKVEKIILATPVIAKDTYKEIKEFFDKIIFIKKPRNFHAVGEFYKNFRQVGNKESRLILNQFRKKKE
ncbi:MAG TPA: phosphoribosyltransferase family protein [Patescibacteria group bacterium]|nr:phosphoribosyltransferase family protein [Patescibacteria group bacterium]